MTDLATRQAKKKPKATEKIRDTVVQQLALLSAHPVVIGLMLRLTESKLGITKRS